MSEYMYLIKRQTTFKTVFKGSLFILDIQTCNFMQILFLFPAFWHTTAFFECLIEQIQNLSVGTAKFIGSPFLNGVHQFTIDA